MRSRPDPIRSGRTVPLLLIVAAALLSSGGAFAAPAGEDSPTFEETTSVLVVEVPVRVVRRGRPVGGLTRDDFRLLDRGREVVISGFEVLDMTAGADVDPSSAPAAGSGRTFLFVYDFALNANRWTLGQLTTGLRRMLGGRLTPADRVGIAFFRGHGELHYVLDYTADPKAIGQALATVDALLFDSFRSARRELGELRAMAPVAPERAFGSGWGREPVLASRARRFVRRGVARGTVGWSEVPDDPLTRETLALLDYRFVSPRKLILNLSHALEGMAEAGHPRGGQKHLVLVSTGWNDVFLYGNRDHVGTTSVLRRIFAALRRQRWVLHGVDAGQWKGNVSDALFYLADGTGGGVFTNSIDTGELLDDLFAQTELIYLLSFQARDLAADGRYHRLRVELIGDADGRGVRVGHRPGYFAPER